MADAVVVPGGRYPPTAPLTWYAGDVAERRGATVHRYVWSGKPPVPPNPRSKGWLPVSVEGWVDGEVTPLLNGIGGRPLLIGKSLGTVSAVVAADRSLPAVWLTPLLSLPLAAATLRRATAPYLLVGGTTDPYWDGALARQLSPHVLEVQDADHTMVVPGPLTESIAVLGPVVVAVEEFLETIAWP
jgi:hypothetical protein